MSMQMTFGKPLFVLLAAAAIGGCTNPAPTVNYQPPPPSPKDGGPDSQEPAAKEDALQDTVFPVNFDLLPTSDGMTIYCTPNVTSNCVPTVCGNSSVEGAEDCDDGNTVPGDGCSTECRQEADWICETPGQPCRSTVECGDGRISGNEECDDFNKDNEDGCSADCKVEKGWTCPGAGVRCQPKCGDGSQKGEEQCDDGNSDPGDGCSDTCKVEDGYACPNAGEPCHKTVCGDGNKEGAESCDDSNTLPNDGCTMDCKAEPVCVGTEGCSSPCGDGLKLPEEECDDGNQRSDDGCSADCKLEADWECKQEVEGKDGDLVVPIIYRDMIPQTAEITDPPPHPNFEVPGRTSILAKGIVKPLLGDDRKPVYNDEVDITESLTTNADDFHSWYHDSNYSMVVVDTLTLARQTNGTFVYDHSGTYSRTAGWQTPPFFPLDDRGWATPPDGKEIPYLGTNDQDGTTHNFSFTSELRYWFEFQGGESLSFTGDDDVWVFVNGQLVVDLGGVHQAMSGTVVLAEGQYSMTVGRTYDIVLFQAERRTTRSSYKLTVGQFSRKHTVCLPRCGDGIVNGNETCDKGKENSDTAYGGCTTQCTPGPFCGDGKTAPDHGEECDDGTNLGKYGNRNACGPGCKKPHYCGDGIVDSNAGERCDNGPDNGKLGGTCTIDCLFTIF
jgi:fibro-slime domain-containing protein